MFQSGDEAADFKSAGATRGFMRTEDVITSSSITSVDVEM
jgi:hypothetical protein